MLDLILMVRQLRDVTFFKVTTRVLVLALMIAGAWVATRTLNFPETVEFNDKVVHVIVFFGFALLMDLASSRHPFWLWKGLPLLAYGIVIEVMQYYSPDRSFSLLDWLADFSGVLLYFLSRYTLLWVASIQSINDQQ